MHRIAVVVLLRIVGFLWQSVVSLAVSYLIDNMTVINKYINTH